MKIFNIFVILSFSALFFPHLSLRGVLASLFGRSGYPRSNLVFPIGIASAIEQPRNDINKFGIHILEPSDLNKAQELVNSNGGDWGWVTVVIRDDDMNNDKWQGFMDQCRERHLVPIVRIATHLEGEYWVKPKIEDTEKWVNFLNNLNWTVSDQYVVIFNEPNHAKEWGGEINPKEYGRILLDFSSKFKVQSSKFNILNAGLDLAAPNSKTTMEALRFMQEMNREVPGIFEKLDGWASHSYPNHGFLGKPWESGKTSIKGYLWEQTVLKNQFKVKKDLPIFITETGWPKSIENCKLKIENLKRSGECKASYYDQDTVASFIKYAFENVWLKDERIKAITPFLLNYPGELFAEFSWLDKEGSPYLQYEIIKNIPKISWWPEQEIKYEVKSISLPPFLPANTEYKGKIILKNVGQSIWGEKGPIEIKATISDSLKISNLVILSIPKTKPGELLTLDFNIFSTEKPGEIEFSWEGLPSYKIKVYPPSILTKAQFTVWEKIISKIKNL